MITLSRAAARGVARAARSSRARASWSVTEHVAVHVVRSVVETMNGLSPERQRRLRPVLERAHGVTTTQIALAGIPAEVHTPPDADLTARIVHFHGGGYVIGAPRETRGYLSRIAVETGVPVVSVDYRLAPEHRHPAALEDADAAIRALIAAGIAPSRIALTGDSAGGGLALAVLMRLRDADVQLAGASLGSPWVDVGCSGASFQRNAGVDMLAVPTVHSWATLFTDDPSDPTASPTHGDFAGLPPLQFVAGDAELLYDDILVAADRARAADVETELLVGRDAVHCWYLARALPGDPDSWRAIASFLGSAIAM